MAVQKGSLQQAVGGMIFSGKIENEVEERNGKVTDLHIWWNAFGCQLLS